MSQTPKLPRTLVARVAHVVISLDHGGLERLVVDWTNQRNRRHPGSTRIICLDRPGDLAAQVAGEGVVHCLNARRSRIPFDWQAVRRLRRVWECGSMGVTACLRAGGSDGRSPQGGGLQILHSHNLAAQQYCALAALGARGAHVHTEHGSNIHVRGTKNSVRLRILARLTDRTVAVSHDTLSQMRPKWRLPGEKTSVITNGVTPHPQYPRTEIDNLRAALGLPPEAFIVGSVGRLAHVKGYDRLLAAFASIERTTRNAPRATLSGGCSDWSIESSGRPAGGFRLLLVGDGPEREALEKQAETLGIRARVVFAGYREEARRCLDMMDLFVLPSRSEGLSVALLEAMAAGVPVAVTDVGDNRRVIDDGTCGRLLPEDEGAWESVISDRCSGGMVERAHRRVAEHYSLDRTLDAYERVYLDATTETA